MRSARCPRWPQEDANKSKTAYSPGCEEGLCFVLGDPRQPLGSLASDMEMQMRPEGKGHSSASRCLPGKAENLLPWVPVNPAGTGPEISGESMVQHCLS